MRTFDFSPLLRSTVGFDYLARLVDDAMAAAEAADNFPPYNIEKSGEETYRITLAVAGFAPDDLEVVAQEDTLVVRGRMKEEEKARTYLHHGIAGRAFERRFRLAEHIRVAGARLENGLLHVDLVREVPEALKPRTIAIQVADQPKRLAQAA